MTEYKPLKVIHWENNNPPSGLPANEKVKRDVLFLPTTLRNNETKEVVGLRFRWTFRLLLNKDKSVLVSFIAEQDFLFTDVRFPPTEIYVWGCIEGSHHFYRKEWDERMKKTELTYEMPPVTKNEVDLPSIMKMIEV